MEVRYLQTEVRAEGSAKSPTLTGYAAKFNSRSRRMPTRGGSFVEQIRAGAFDRALQKTDTIANIEHNRQLVLGRRSAGNLELKCDSVGLAVRCHIDPMVSYAADLWANVRSRLVRNMSFAFTTPEDGSGEVWSMDDDDDDENRKCAVRTLTNIEDLFDVSFVLDPAYDDTEADARTLFPDGVPELVETRSASGRIILPKKPTIIETYADTTRRAAMRDTQKLLS